MTKKKFKLYYLTDLVEGTFENDLLRYRLDSPAEVKAMIKTEEPLFTDIECHEKNYTATRTVQLYQAHWEKAIIFDTNDYPLDEIYQAVIKDNHIVAHYQGMEANMFSNDRGSQKFPYDRWDDTFLMGRIALAGKVESFGLDGVSAYCHEYDYYSAYARELGYKADELVEFKKAMQKSFLNSPKSDKMALPLREQHLVYAAYDVLVMPLVWEKTKHVRDEFIIQLDKAIIPYVIEYGHRGLPVYRPNWEKSWKLAQEHIDHATGILPMVPEKKNNKLTGGEVPLNVNSYLQVRALLNSTESDDTYLAKMIQQDGEYTEHALAIREKRKYLKQQNFLIRFDKERVTGFHYPATISGRMACDNDNVLQIPRDLKGVFGFADDNDKWIVHCDYAALELRMMCAVLNDPVLDRLFREGVDLHKYAASKIYDIHIDDVPKFPHRFVGKTGNFGLGYGAGVGRFRDMCVKNAGLWLSEKEAGDIVRGWRELYPSVKAWHARNNRSKDNMDITLGGRPYKANLYTDLNAVKMQGSSAEVFKLALLYLKKKQAPVMNAIHDSYLEEANTFEEAKQMGFELYKCMIVAWFEIIRMSDNPDLPMPLTVDIGKNWKDIEADEGENIQAVHHIDYPGTIEDYHKYKDEVQNG